MYRVAENWKVARELMCKSEMNNSLSSANNEARSDVDIKYDLGLNNTQKCGALYKNLNLKYAYCILI